MLDIVRPSLQTFGEVEVRNEGAGAAEVTARRHLDGFIVDCETCQGGIELVRSIRHGRSNQQSTLFAVVNRKTSFPQCWKWAPIVIVVGTLKLIGGNANNVFSEVASPITP